MANAPTQPEDPQVDSTAPTQGDVPGAYGNSDRSRPIQSPPSRVKGVAIAIGVAVLAIIALAVATGDGPNPPRDGNVPSQPAR